MPDTTLSIARKHISISLQLKHIVSVTRRDLGVFVATYTSGARGQSYQSIEEASGEEFWSIKAWTPPPPPRRRLKDPDLIITRGSEVRFLVEVKWGAVEGRPGSDLQMNDREWAEFQNILHQPADCIIHGPAVQNHRRFKSPLPLQGAYRITPNTNLVLVSDFQTATRLAAPVVVGLLARSRTIDPRFLIADINSRVGIIPAFEELLAASH